MVHILLKQQREVNLLVIAVWPTEGEKFSRPNVGCLCVCVRTHTQWKRTEKDSCELLSFLLCLCVCARMHVHVCMPKFQWSSTQASHCSKGNPTSKLSMTAVHLQPLCVCVRVCVHLRLRVSPMYVRVCVYVCACVCVCRVWPWSGSPAVVWMWETVYLKQLTIAPSHTHSDTHTHTHTHKISVQLVVISL